MANLNKVMVIGNVTREPEIRHTSGGAAVTNFTVAVNESWKDKDGNKQERTEFVNCVAWAKQAELIGEYVSKGDPIYVEGSLQTRKWEDNDGNTRYTTEVKLNNFQFLASKGGAHKSAEPEQDDIPF
jgi:single-strand DNA-binding protein